MPITFKTKAGEGVTIPTEAGRPAPSLAETARVAYDVERAKAAHPMGGLADATNFSFGLSPFESGARFGTQEYAGAPRANVEPMTEVYQRYINQPQSMVAGGIDAVLPVPVASLASRYVPREMMAQMAQGGRPYYSGGLLDGVFLDGRYTGFGQDPRFQQIEEEPQQEVVLPEYDATANAKRCPDGYVFDEQLQACRLATTIPNMPTTDRTAFYQQPYQPMGLLDQDGYEYGVPLIYG